MFSIRFVHLDEVCLLLLGKIIAQTLYIFQVLLLIGVILIQSFFHRCIVERFVLPGCFFVSCHERVDKFLMLSFTCGKLFVAGLKVSCVAGFHLMHAGVPHLFCCNMCCLQIPGLFLVILLFLIEGLVHFVALGKMRLMHFGCQFTLPLDLILLVNILLGDFRDSGLVILAFFVMLSRQISDVHMELIASLF